MQNNDMALSGNSTKGSMLLKYPVLLNLLGEERPRDMLILFGILVSLFHLWLFMGLIKPDEEVSEAKPLTMEVSMIAIPSPKKPVAEPPKSAPPPPAEKKPPVPKKVPTPPKPVVQKTKPPAPKPVPLSEEPAEFAPFKPSEPVAAPAPASPPPSSTSSSSSTTSSQSNSTSTFTEANFRANYAHNPKPEYPAVARSRGWQGKVLLRVKVSTEGLSDDVSVEQSSGHDILDESAVEAVKKWRFIPAKRGDTPVASSVIVPIDFKLRN